ncbi:alpha-glucosidase [Acidaminobacter sp. JC074]|nr:alpha-glucosidase [Acidaminobacter sp. JC074]
MNHYHDESIDHTTGKLKKIWWKEAVVYQIYPRSFKDGDGDGIGDIKGIIEKLEYLKDLGVDVIWLSPIYDSPNDDNGYDIRNYKKILSDFGTMADFDLLLEEVHNKGMKLIMDLVINHTSDEHEWFKLSRLNDEIYQDYYICRDKPNNWQSMFGGSAWTYDESREAYYLHVFSKKQPDLNWDNPDVRNDLFQMVNWWLDKGIDGFRLDVINFISKETGLPDGNESLGKMTNLTGIEHYMYGPRVHDFLQELNRASFKDKDIMTVGECPGIGIELMKYFTHDNRDELNMIFNFDHLYSHGRDKWQQKPYDIEYLKHTLFKYQELGSPYWNTLFMNNHDTPRMLGKLLKDQKHKAALAKMLGLLSLTMRGTPFIYQGQEIGMNNPDFKHISQFRDIESINKYHELRETDLSEEAVIDLLNEASRDNARLPVSWSSEKNAGFSIHTPWIKNSDDYMEVNVEDQLLRKDSVLSFYKNMIQFRKEHKTLIYGKTVPYKANDKGVMIYERRLGKDVYLIIINLEEKTKDIGLSMKKYIMLLSSYETSNVLYKPYEARVYKMV